MRLEEFRDEAIGEIISRKNNTRKSERTARKTQKRKKKEHERRANKNGDEKELGGRRAEDFRSGL